MFEYKNIAKMLIVEYILLRKICLHNNCLSFGL